MTLYFSIDPSNLIFFWIFMFTLMIYSSKENLLVSMYDLYDRVYIIIDGFFPVS